MLIHVGTDGRISLSPEGHAHFDYEGGSETIFLAGPGHEEQRAKLEKQSKRGIFVVLNGIGQYGGPPNADGKHTWPYRVDTPCSLAEVLPQRFPIELQAYANSGSNSFKNKDALIHSYRLRIDVSDIYQGEGSYDEWHFDFTSVANNEDYESTRILTGRITIVSECYSWFVKVASPKEANPIWIHCPDYQDEIRRPDGTKQRSIVR